MQPSKYKELANSKFGARVLMFFSGTFMGTVGLYVNALNVHSTVTVCMRGVFTGVFLLLYFSIRRNFKIFHHVMKVWKIELLQGFTSSIIIFLYFQGIQKAGFAVAAFLLYSGGLFALIFFRLFIKEKITLRKWIAFIIAIIGVGIIMEPWKLSVRLNIGIIYSLIAGLILGLDITIRKTLFIKIREIEGFDEKILEGPDFYMATVFVQTIVMTIIFLPLSYKVLIEFTGMQWLISILLGFFPGVIAFSFYNLALRKDEGGDVVIISYVEPIIATILNVILLKELGLMVIIGGLIIISGNLIVILDKKK